MLLQSIALLVLGLALCIPAHGLSCKRIEKEVFGNSVVKVALSGFDRIRVGVTEHAADLFA